LQEVHHSSDDGCDDDPEKLKPVKERYPNKLWLAEIVERRIKHYYKGQYQQNERPGTVPFPRTARTNHESFPFLNYIEPSRMDAR
jgi:hypothetical protein